MRSMSLAGRLKPSFTRLPACVLTMLACIAPVAAHAMAASAEQRELAQRVAAVRHQLAAADSTVQPRSRQQSPSLGRLLAQWGNWNNWKNWGNGR